MRIKSFKKTPSRREDQNKFYSSYAWRKMVDFIWERDNHLCQICLAEGKRHYLKRYTKDLSIQGTVDHIQPRNEGGSDKSFNLRLIGSNHHNAKSSGERKGIRKNK